MRLQFYIDNLMRKILFSLGIIASSASWAQNAFLTNEYWKANPSPQQVAKDINEKNNEQCTSKNNTISH